MTNKTAFELRGLKQATPAERVVKLKQRIESLEVHIENLMMITGEGRTALAEQFKDKVVSLKQRVYELNLQIEGV